MSSPGMWMPKQKDGKNWIVSYSGIANGEAFNQDRKFRVREDARDFVDHIGRTERNADNLTIDSISINKI